MNRIYGAITDGAQATVQQWLTNGTTAESVAVLVEITTHSGISHSAFHSNRQSGVGHQDRHVGSLVPPDMRFQREACFNYSQLLLLLLWSGTTSQPTCGINRDMGAATPSRYSRRVFQPGQTAPVTGIYLVAHERHRPDHPVVVIRGEEFPACRSCKGAVRFTIDVETNHVAQDFDFAGPNLFVVKKK